MTTHSCNMISILFLTIAICLPVYGYGSVPADLEIIGSSGGLAPLEENYIILITADGRASYVRYILSSFTDPPLEKNDFLLGRNEVEQIWQAIQDNDFFNIPPEHNNPTIQDRTFASLVVKANGNTHRVTTKNIAVPAFDNIIAVINSISPYDLLYDTSEPPAFTPRDICDRSGVSRANVAQVKENNNKIDALSLRSSIPLQEPNSTGEPPHPGTVSAYKIPLNDDTANLGIINLASKGGGFYGDRVAITVDNRKNQKSEYLVFKLYLEFWAPGAIDEENVKKIKDAIEKEWGKPKPSFHNKQNDKFQTIVETRSVHNASPPGTLGYHQIKLDDNPKTVGSVNGMGTDFDVNRGVGSGTWKTSDSSKKYAYLAGRLFGLPKRFITYERKTVLDPETGKCFWSSDGVPPLEGGRLVTLLNDRKSCNVPTAEEICDISVFPIGYRITVPDEGHNKDVMGAPECNDAVVQQTDIDDIAGKAGLLVKIRPGPITVSKDGTKQNFSITRTEDMFVSVGKVKTLDGLYVACLDYHKLPPVAGSVLDLAPSLDKWTNIQAAPLLLQLLRYVDENELFCELYPVQQAVWRITDNKLDIGEEAKELLRKAGINLPDDQVLDFPKLTNPNSSNPETGLTNPPELHIGDFDGDTDTDRNDLNILLANLNKKTGVSSCISCDLDDDGTITVLDARKLILLCTRPRCATN